MKVRVKNAPKSHWYSGMEGKEFEVIGKSDEHEAYLVEVPKYTGRYIYYVDCEEVNTDAHYDNSNGSLYKFAEDHGLNAYEFDCIKRIVRCRKKGHFREDLEKTVRVINLYLKEYEPLRDSKSNDAGR